VTHLQRYFNKVCQKLTLNCRGLVSTVNGELLASIVLSPAEYCIIAAVTVSVKVCLYWLDFNLGTVSELN